ncbi:ectonucleoside triphosphate diphosphohydrolase 5 [Dermatophagoides farinae]|uniref:ectonucleoside triphosphate diphosphohydrolase 5 n=1 Tax=Dermatophagoides farinae TaxID=6954 RepID=UPI003F6037B0
MNNMKLATTTTMMTFITKMMTKQLYILFILITALSITGPFISFNSKYYGTQLIRHPIESTKDMIKDQNFVIILDGGSTGTRIHIFAFEINFDIKQQRILLEREDFFHTTPGLSSFHHNLTELSKNLRPLIGKALDIVPGFLADRTPIILKATAGLRLLSNRDANRILQHVHQQFRSLPFKVDDDSVTMLEENDEGLFAWYTVNFLLHKLHKINESIATLDLGGGSTQITFSTYNMNTLIRSHQYIVQRNIEGEQEFIYTHSYLGLGLMSARRSILANDIDHSKSSSIKTEYNHHHEYWIRSPCFKILHNETYHWQQDQIVFHIQYNNDGDGQRTWFECLSRVEHFVIDANIDRPEELQHREIYAISYFYDRMKDIKVIRNDSGRVRVGDFFLYAENVCRGMIRIRRQNPFLCVDLTYIACYLHYGLGIPMTKDIMLVKKINGIEISWALGAAINLFHH